MKDIWIKVKKGQFESDNCLVTIREKQIAFNATFGKMAELQRINSALIRHTPDMRKVNFLFSEEKSSASDSHFAVKNDGGNEDRKTNAKIIQK